MIFNPYTFAENKWSEEDYKTGTMHGSIAKGTRDEELQEVLPFLQNKRNAVDVGARVGSYTRSCHTAGFQYVYAFEVLEQHMEEYSRNIDLSRATMWNYAVLDKLGNYGLSGKRVLLQEGATPTCTVDYFEFTEVDLIKIDIDSYDHLVLQGCIETIKRNRPVVQMEWGVLQRKYNPKMKEEDAWKCLFNLGYTKAGVSTNDNLILVPCEIFS